MFCVLLVLLPALLWHNVVSAFEWIYLFISMRVLRIYSAHLHHRERAFRSTQLGRWAGGRTNQWNAINIPHTRACTQITAIQPTVSSKSAYVPSSSVHYAINHSLINLSASKLMMAVSIRSVRSIYTRKLYKHSNTQTKKFADVKYMYVVHIFINLLLWVSSSSSAYLCLCLFDVSLMSLFENTQTPAETTAGRCWQ